LGIEAEADARGGDGRRTPRADHGLDLDLLRNNHRSMPRAMLLLHWFLLSLALLSCKGGPSDQEIAGAVTQAAKDSKGYNDLVKLVPEDARRGNGVTRNCGVMAGPISEVTAVEVTQRGEPNEKEGYVPVMVKLTGKCNAEKPNCGEDKNHLCPAVVEDFVSPELPFRLRKDDYGKWTAQPGDGKVKK
jgi:hypothetical protein